MRFVTKFGGVTIGTLLAVALSLGMAHAAPENNPNAEVIDLYCGQPIGHIQIVAPSTSDNANENAPAWGVGHVVGSNMVLIPFSFHFEGSFTPVGGETQYFSFDQTKGKGKAGPAGGTYVTCTFSQSGSDETGDFVFNGTVVALIPQGHGAH
jgi:hypothetical protein